MGEIAIDQGPSFANSAAREENCTVPPNLSNYVTIKGKLGSAPADPTYKGDLHDAYRVGFYKQGLGESTIGKDFAATLKMGIGSIKVYGYCGVKGSSLPCSQVPQTGSWIYLNTYRPGTQLFDVLTTSIKVEIGGHSICHPVCPSLAKKSPKLTAPKDPSGLWFVPTLGIKQYGKSSAYTIELH